MRGKMDTGEWDEGKGGQRQLKLYYYYHYFFVKREKVKNFRPNGSEDNRAQLNKQSTVDRRGV